LRFLPRWQFKRRPFFVYNFVISLLKSRSDRWIKLFWPQTLDLSCVVSDSFPIVILLNNYIDKFALLFILRPQSKVKPMLPQPTTGCNHVISFFEFWMKLVQQEANTVDSVLFSRMKVRVLGQIALQGSSAYTFAPIAAPKSRLSISPHTPENNHTFRRMIP